MRSALQADKSNVKIYIYIYTNTILKYIDFFSRFQKTIKCFNLKLQSSLLYVYALKPFLQHMNTHPLLLKLNAFSAYDHGIHWSTAIPCCIWGIGRLVDPWPSHFVLVCVLGAGWNFTFVRPVSVTIWLQQNLRHILPLIFGVVSKEII